MAKGKLITVEGIEGAGKSTAMQLIRTILEESGQQVVVTREPGGTELAEEIRNVLLHPVSAEKMQLDTELLLMFAARAQHVSMLIRPALEAGSWVVSDRYIDASYAYQGGGRGIPLDRIALLDRWIVDGVYPVLTLLLDVAPDVGILRAERRGFEKDRIEQEKLDFFARVRDVYLDRAKADPERIKVINANEQLFAVESQIRDVLKVFLTRE
jgi:dTMP kinase